MSDLIERAATIVEAQASTTPMTTEQVVEAINKVYAALKNLEAGVVTETAADEARPAITLRQAFKKDEVVCMVCGKTGFKTLTRHLKQAHDMKPGQYRKQFGIPSKQPLVAKSYSETRKKMAEERGLTDVLAKAREARKAGTQAKKAAPVAKKASKKSKSEPASES